MSADTTTEKLAQYVTDMAERAIAADEEARAKLAEAAASGQLLDSFVLKPAMEAQIAALLWRSVLARAERGLTVLEALASVREEVTERLLTRGESQSTCGITNEAERMKREADREFLRVTNGLV